MSGDLTNLIFGKPLEVSQLFGPSEKSHFGGFMDQYVPAEDARGRRMYVHCTKGYSVWERPETILGLLLANKYIPRTLSVERWVSIPKSPLIIIDCGDGYLLLANKINGRVKLDVDEPIWGMIGHEAEKALKGPAYQKDSQKSYGKVPTIMEVLENLQSKASRTEEEKQDPTVVSIVQKNAFFDVLRENSVPVLGDYQRIFENLASSSRDVRLHAVPTTLMQSLLEEYVTNQKKSLEEQARNQREV